MNPQWVAVCRIAELEVERGAAALVGGRSVAIFRAHDHRVYALGDRDPFSGANVISRGIVGTRADIPFVASPMHKQAFDLRTGRCLDDASVALPVHRVRVADGVVEVWSSQCSPAPRDVAARPAAPIGQPR